MFRYLKTLVAALVAAVMAVRCGDQGRWTMKNFGLVVLAMVALVIAGCGGGSSALDDSQPFPSWKRAMTDYGTANDKGVKRIIAMVMAPDFEWRSSALTTAARTHHCKVVEALLNGGFDFTVPGNREVTWPINEALRYSLGPPHYKHRLVWPDRSYTEVFRERDHIIGDTTELCVQALLQHGANPNLGGELHKAAIGGHAAAVGAFLEHGVDPNLLLHGLTALHVAAWVNGDEERYYGDVTEIWGSGSSEYEFCCGHSNVVRVLLDHGADPSIETPGGFTALHLAAISGSVSAIKMLLEHGVDPNVRDVIDGNTPLHLVKSSNRAAVVELIRGGADRNLRNNEGRLAQHVGEELQQAADSAAAAEAQRRREDRIRREAREEREAAAQARRDREDEIRAEEREERTRRDLERRGEELIDRALCMQDPGCRAIYHY